MQHQDRKSRLFFIEFLIVLFFFLIISTVCLRLFAHALSHAQAEAASAAELISASENPAEFLISRYPHAAFSGDTLTQTFDRDFKTCAPEAAVYTMNIFLYSEGTASDGITMNLPRPGVPQTKILDPATDKNADIHITDKNGDEIFTLSVSFHTPLTRMEVLS